MKNRLNIAKMLSLALFMAVFSGNSLAQVKVDNIETLIGSFKALAAVLAGYPQRRNFALAVNYCLIPGRNDGPGAAEGVAAFLRAAAPSGRAVLNLIPCNPGSSPIGREPTEAEIESFAKRLEAAGAFVKL